MNISIIGTGYVGLVQGVVMADFGMNVICMDVDCSKISMLNKGKVPIYEPGLEELLNKNIATGRLHFTGNIIESIHNCDIIFIAVGTPSKEDGSADLKYILEVARQIGRNIKRRIVIVNKSTVPVGTGKLVRQTIQEELDARNAKIDFDVVSNPEFLREGRAVQDCLLPDRIVIGTESDRAAEMMKKVYDVLFINQTPFLFTNIETAEMIKYASNAFLAVKISFINEMALLAEKAGANIQEIARGMGMDGRISPKFLHAGPGYGGSCFPKDTRAIADIARNHGEQLMIVEAAINANEKQKQKMVEKITSELSKKKKLSETAIAVWGLSFKPETDDVRDAPSIDIIRGLIKEGIKIQAYCPKGIPEAKWRLEDVQHAVTYFDSEYSVAEGADALVLITEWAVFRGVNLKSIRELMRGNIFFDLRNVFRKNKEIKNIFEYHSVGGSD